MSFLRRSRRWVAALLLPVQATAAHAGIVVVTRLGTPPDDVACFSEPTIFSGVAHGEEPPARIGLRQQQIPIEECVELYDEQRGKSCGAPDGFEVKIRNRCGESIDAKFCLERTNGKWDCGMNSNMRPGAKTSYYTCHGTGRVWRWARRAGSQVRTPDPNTPNTPPSSGGGDSELPSGPRPGLGDAPSSASPSNTPPSRPRSYDELQYSQRDDQGRIVQRAIWTEHGRQYCSQTPQAKASPQSRCVFRDGSSPYAFKELAVVPEVTFPGRRP